jgi:hypothetical protein
MKQTTLPLPLELLLLEQSMIMTMRPTVERSLRLHWILCVSTLHLSNPSAIDTAIPLHSPMELLVTDYTTTSPVTVPAGATTGTVSVPYNCDTIETNETLLLPLERLRLLEQSMIMTMPTVATSLRLRLLKDPAVFEFSLTILLLWT